MKKLFYQISSWALAGTLALVLFAGLFIAQTTWAVSPEEVILVGWDFNDKNIIADFGISSNLSQELKRSNDTNIKFDNDKTAYTEDWAGEDDYWQIAFSTLGYENIKVSSKQRSSNTGPKNFQLQYKIDGSDWTNSGDVLTLEDNYTSGVLDLFSLSEISNQENVSLRWIRMGTSTVDNEDLENEGNSNIDDIYAFGTPIVIPVTNISVPTDSVTVLVGATTSVVVTITPEDATNKTLVWNSNDESIATVSEDGEITGVATGTTKIIVAAQDDENIFSKIEVMVISEEDDDEEQEEPVEGETPAPVVRSSSGSWAPGFGPNSTPEGQVLGMATSRAEEVARARKIRNMQAQLRLLKRELVLRKYPQLAQVGAVAPVNQGAGVAPVAPTIVPTTTGGEALFDAPVSVDDLNSNPLDDEEGKTTSKKPWWKFWSRN